MVSNNWLFNNGKPMDAPMAFLCSETPILHLLSAARERGLISGTKSTQVTSVSLGHQPLTRL